MKAKFLIAALLVFAAVIPAGSAFAQTTSTVTGTVGLNPAACLQLSSNLYIGAHDASTAGQVTMLQNFLNARYGNQLVTGYFGTMTYANVVRLQQEFSLPRVGGVGPLTRAALVRLCTGNPPPTNTGLSAFPTSGPSPLSVSFTAVTPDANQYILEFGDGANSGPFVESMISHTYTNPGTYTATLSRYISCLYATPIHCMIAVQNIGQVTVTVTTPTQNSGFNVTSPTAGQVYTRGNDMNITWSGLIHATFAAEQDSSIIDLYTAAGSKVGTIAIANGIAGTYGWHIPGFPQTYMCTMQYPNGLCGTNIQGQYYVKVTAVVGNGFDANPTLIGTTQSGVFTIQLP